jgi:predicted metal-binding membrane protein
MTGPGIDPVESVLRRDRLLVAGALVVIIALAWAWLLTGAGTGMSPLAMHGEG